MIFQNGSKRPWAMSISVAIEKWYEDNRHLSEFSCYSKTQSRGGVKMAEEQDGEITFSSTNSLKEQQNGEQSLQNNF